MDGKLERAGDRWRLRFQRELAHDPEVVWRALTEPEQLAAWFPHDIEGERAAGAPLQFVSRNGEAPPFAGEMLVYEPPQLLEMRWGDDVLRFELEPREHGCVLTLLDTFAELGKAARDGAGWHVCLDALGRSLADEPSPSTTVVAWRDLHPGYVAEFGPEASTIGPPPGHDAAGA